MLRMSEGHLSCVHTIRFFRTNKESSIWRQNDHAKFVGTFHLSRRVSDENRACPISIRFFKITDPTVAVQDVQNGRTIGWLQW